MEERIREYMEQLFYNAPNTRKAFEMKLELTENLLERYHGLLEEGKAPEDAYNLTIMSIGNVKELFYNLQEDTEFTDADDAKKRTAHLLTICAVMIYILSLVPVVLFNSGFTTALMLVMIAAATGLILYAQGLKPKADIRGEENVVSEFKDWQSRSQNQKQLKRSLNLILWSLILIAYFLISFATMKWWITWLIFLLGAALQGLLSAIFHYKSMR